MSPVKAVLLATGVIVSGVAVPLLAAGAARSAPRRVDVAVEGFTDGRNWHFTPKVLRFNYGDTVHVRFTAQGAGHGFRVTGKDFDLNAFPGLPQEVTFVADWVGGREFYCTFDCGVGHGQMSGMIVVARERCGVWGEWIEV